MTIKYELKISGVVVETFDKRPAAIKRKETLQKENPGKPVILRTDYGN